MIENNLTYQELKIILTPILKIDPIEKTYKSFEAVYKESIKSGDDITNHHKNEVRYNKFVVHARGFGEMVEGHGAYITLQFRIKKLWFHSLLNPSKSIVRDLMQIVCEVHPNFTFKKYVNSYNDGDTGVPRMVQTVYNIDSRAYNPDWENGIEISPLIVVSSSNEEYHFVEFNFNPNCYIQTSGTITLKEDWLTYIKDIDKYIERKVKETLKYAFKNQ